eukprot:358307-Chlamydomonas_euryale.AAC.7
MHTLKCTCWPVTTGEGGATHPVFYLLCPLNPIICHLPSYTTAAELHRSSCRRDSTNGVPIQNWGHSIDTRGQGVSCGRPASTRKAVDWALVHTIATGDSEWAMCNEWLLNTILISAKDITPGCRATLVVRRQRTQLGWKV